MFLKSYYYILNTFKTIKGEEIESCILKLLYTDGVVQGDYYKFCHFKFF